MTDIDQAAELIEVGRNHFWSNDIGDAVRCLSEAALIAQDSKTKAQALLELGPALSKAGQPEDAIAALNKAEKLAPGYAGKALNKRAVILADMGDFNRALETLEQSLELLDSDTEAETRAQAMLNLGAVNSEAGRLDHARQWYSRARTLTESLGQQLETAMIDGNLGYVESRRANFAQSLRWYEQGRQGFKELGESGLALAVLEVDHARTLVDIGLVAEAAEAAATAASSARLGNNRMLEVQAVLLRAEALLKSGDTRAGGRIQLEGKKQAEALGLEQLVLWANYLADLKSDSDVEPAAPTSSQLPPTTPQPHMAVATDEPMSMTKDPDEDIDRFIEAGWFREAHECVVGRAQRFARTDPTRALNLLERTRRWSDEADLDPVKVAVTGLIEADLRQDRDSAHVSMHQGLQALEQQRALVGSVELLACLPARALELQSAALSFAAKAPAAGEAVLWVLESTRVVANRRSLTEPDAVVEATAKEGFSKVRDARVSVAEARFSGGDVRSAYANLRQAEQHVLRQYRRVVGSGSSSVDTHASAANIDSPESLSPLPADTVGITFATIDHRLVGVRVDGAGVDLVDLGSADAVRAASRVQRMQLRKLADERRTTTSRSFENLEAINQELEALLVQPLDLPTSGDVVVAPAPNLGDVCWSALPTLFNRSTTIVSSFRDWLDSPESLKIERVTAIGGPDLDRNLSEVDKIVSLWGSCASGKVEATRSDALRALADRNSLVHVAAHGALRPDNPFFSTIEFVDGAVTLFEMASATVRPTMMILASCDAAAVSQTGHAASISTVSELRNHGVAVVIAPVVAVNHAAAAEYSFHLHKLLAGGVTINEAALSTRQTLYNSGDARQQAAAMAFQVFGGRSTASPLILK